MSRKRKRGQSMELSDDEARLIRLFRVLNHERSEVLVQAAKEAMNSYSVDPSILRYGNPKEALADELGSSGCEDERLKRCLTRLREEYVWLNEMWPWLDDIIEEAWSDSVVEIVLGESTSDEQSAERLQEAIGAVYREHRPQGSRHSFEKVSTKYLVKFIRDWRERVVLNLEKKIGSTYFSEKLPTGDGQSA